MRHKAPGPVPPSTATLYCRGVSRCFSAALSTADGIAVWDGFRVPFQLLAPPLTVNRQTAAPGSHLWALLSFGYSELVIN